MKKQFWTVLFLFVFAFSVSAQDNNARKFIEFGRIPCGQFMAEMDLVFQSFLKMSDNKIYVVYYGERYRKVEITNKNHKVKKNKLEYPHREDGLNFAKSIPFFLYSNIYNSFDQRIKEDEIVLIDGGFREETEVEIWFVVNGEKSPEPSPTIDEKYITFRKDKPYLTPAYTKCYGYN